MKALLLALLVLLSPSAWATELDYASFATLPVLQDGRIKPLDSFARATLQQLAEADSLPNSTAIAWLAKTVFDPGNAAEQPVFAVSNPQVRKLMGLEGPNRALFSLVQLAPGLSTTAAQAASLLERDPRTLTADEQALFTLHTHVLFYNQLLQSLSLLLPLPMPPPSGIAGQTFLDLQKAEQDLLATLSQIMKKKGDNLDAFTEDGQTLASFVFSLQKLRESGAGNITLRIAPSVWDGQNQTWLSPWEVVLSGQSAPQTGAYLALWQQMATAYRTNNAAAWAQSSEAARQLIAQKISPVQKQRLLAERLYTSVKPYPIAMALYAVGAVLALWSLGGAALALLLGAALHGAGMAARVFILDRPPVGTLYESALFVALVTVLVGVLVGWRSRLAPVMAGGAIAALLLLAIAPVLQPEGDNLGMLPAVLNTNFWLGVHVLSITAGYGFCLLTAMLAHALLVLKNREGLFALMHRLSLAALLLTAVGTILGGIWADQSWGRFWGWDPKENGALLICLWLIWLQHGRLSGHIGSTAYTAGMAFLAVVVALAWFGINLLGVGLHSYGFTSGIAGGLFAFCVIEVALISALWWRQTRHAP